MSSCLTLKHFFFGTQNNLYLSLCFTVYLKQKSKLPSLINDYKAQSFLFREWKIQNIIHYGGAEIVLQPIFILNANFLRLSYSKNILNWNLISECFRAILMKHLRNIKPSHMSILVFSIQATFHCMLIYERRVTQDSLWWSRSLKVMP